MSGGGQKGSSTQVTEVKLPEWVNQASQANYKQAQQVAGRPYEAYPGQIVADWSPNQQAAAGMLPQVGQYQGAYGAAGQALSGLLDYNPQQIQTGAVQAGSIPGTDLSRYTNPYTENVIDRTISNMERSGQLAQGKLASEAVKGGSFGGSRQAMQQAIQGAETTRGIGDYAGKARADAYGAATALASQDLDRALKGDTTNLQNWTDVQKNNATNELMAKGLQRQAADDLVAAATAGQQSAIMTLGQYMQVGEKQQAQQQNVLNAQRGQWQEQRDYPLEQLQIVMSALGMSPYGKTETTNKTSQQQQSPDMVGGIAGTLGALAPMMKFLPALAASDRSMKTDVQPMGKDEDTGIPVAAYRYKGDPKSYPKVVGPMAQDVAKKAPRLVRKIAGKKAIDLTRLVA